MIDGFSGQSEFFAWEKWKSLLTFPHIRCVECITHTLYNSNKILKVLALCQLVQSTTYFLSLAWRTNAIAIVCELKTISLISRKKKKEKIETISLGKSVVRFCIFITNTHKAWSLTQIREYDIRLIFFVFVSYICEVSRLPLSYAQLHRSTHAHKVHSCNFAQSAVTSYRTFPIPYVRRMILIAQPFIEYRMLSPLQMCVATESSRLLNN